MGSKRKEPSAPSPTAGASADGGRLPSTKVKKKKQKKTSRGK